MTYITLVVAVLATLGVVFLLKKSGKPAAKEPVRRQAAALSPKLPITPSATPQAAPQPALRTITRTANPHIEAMLKGFEFTRNADLSAEEAKAVVDMLVRIPRPPSALHKLVSPEFLA